MSSPAEWFLVLLHVGSVVVTPAGEIGRGGVAVGPIEESACRHIIGKASSVSGYELTCRRPDSPVCITPDVAGLGTFKLCRDLASMVQVP